MPHPTPSLNALRAFEVAARHGSFAEAAGEIGVTPAAISQQIRGLEARLGRKLFHRVGKGILPTEAGLEVLPSLTEAFGALSAVSRQLQTRPLSARLTVSVPPSFAVGWLSDRIGDFLLAGRRLEISLRAEEDPIAFERDKVDVRLSYGRFRYPEHRVESLMTDRVLPFCSPAFLARVGPIDSPRRVSELPLIHTDWGPLAASYPSWRVWFGAVGLDHEGRERRGHTANSSKLALDLAAGGAGLVLGQRLLASDHLAAGRLVCPLNRPLELSAPYCLTVPAPRAARPFVADFADWFRRAIRESMSAPP